MSKNRSQNILLVEIMIAVLFFALCSTVILEVFVTAREYSERSMIKGDAMIVMQDVGEQLYAAENCEEDLNAAGFECMEDVWHKEYARYRLELRVDETATEAGMLREWQISALQDEDVIAKIPGARYIPGGTAE